MSRHELSKILQRHAETMQNRHRLTGARSLLERSSLSQGGNTWDAEKLQQLKGRVLAGYVGDYVKQVDISEDKEYVKNLFFLTKNRKNLCFRSCLN